MPSSLPPEIQDQIVRENRHFAAAPQAFFEAWKRGVELAGPNYFGSTDYELNHLVHATNKDHLRPILLRIADDLGVLSGGERLFLSAMVSFYDSREGGAMLKRCGFEGLSDLGRLDLQRRQIVADLLLNYDGW